MWRTGLILAVLLSALAMMARAGNVQPLLDKLGQAETEAAASALIPQIWNDWINGHANDAEKEQMRAGLQAMERRDLAAAEKLFSELVETNPAFVEAWNKRATIRFMRGDLSGSESDVIQVLTLEPRHFGAISGLGLISLQQDNPEKALRAYEILLRVHPFSQDARRFVPELRERLGISDI